MKWRTSDVDLEVVLHVVDAARRTARETMPTTATITAAVPIVGPTASAVSSVAERAVSNDESSKCLDCVNSDVGPEVRRNQSIGISTPNATSVTVGVNNFE
jgi:hypothetical protein